MFILAKAIILLLFAKKKGESNKTLVKAVKIKQGNKIDHNTSYQVLTNLANIELTICPRVVASIIAAIKVLK